ncbi:unnamed protein product [Effrenium voratum]|uniref:Uncharacterized protein n=1 Tax=Effrenium voratum TaxID=2562239 RepID=A0AA36J7N9_9DINO|nr:unnamed protein product [Effrenium voratum]CAJ1435236.1 unnamed protein product [Effrenium voratum]
MASAPVDFTEVKEEDSALEEGTLIAQAPPVDAGGAFEDEEQPIVEAGTVIAQVPPAEEDSESEDEEEEPPIVEGTLISQGTADAEADASGQPDAEEDQERWRQKRWRSPDPTDDVDGRRERPPSYGRRKAVAVLNLQRSWIKSAEDVRWHLEQDDSVAASSTSLLDYQEVDFSNNKMTNMGLSEVVKLCKRCPGLRVLKLFGNAIDDEGAMELASIMRYCRVLEQLHLSHNWITEKGVVALVEQAVEHLEDAYQHPLWLRVEKNRLADAPRCAQELLERYPKILCPREDRRRCTNRTCINQCRIHIPFLIDERSGKGKDWRNWKFEDGYSNSRYGGHNSWSSHKSWRQPSRSRTPPCAVRLRERDSRRERTPIHRREVYYREITTYPQPQKPRAPREARERREPRRAPTPPQPRRRRASPRREVLSPPRARARWEPEQPRRNRIPDPPVAARATRPVQPPPRPPVRRPPSPPRPKAHQPTAAPQPEESEYDSYDYYTDYSSDEAPPIPPAGHVVVPPVKAPQGPLRYARAPPLTNHQQAQEIYQRRAPFPQAVGQRAGMEVYNKRRR